MVQDSNIPIVSIERATAAIRFSIASGLSSVVLICQGYSTSKTIMKLLQNSALVEYRD